MFDIRIAEETDLKAIMNIYNQAVLRTTGTFDIEVKTITEQKEWFDQHNNNYPILVCTIDEEVIGWSSLSKWSERSAYSDTVELSVFVHENYRGRGYGRKLMEAILQMGSQLGIHTVISRIVTDNKVSLHLHEALGFVHIGIMKEVGRKFGQLLDVAIMQLIY